MRFVVNERRSIPRFNKFPVAVLQRDRWDDFGIKTTFFLTIFLSSAIAIEIGDVKIFKKGQRTGSTQLPTKPFTQLSGQFASLGQSYSFYENLKSIQPSIYSEVLVGLRDVLLDRPRLEEFSKEKAFSSSVLRAATASAALTDAGRLFGVGGDFRQSATNQRVFTFETRVGGDKFKITFGFDPTGLLPGRINVLIGCNGSGKTRLLANLAMGISGASAMTTKAAASRYGRVVGGAPKFSSVLALSYSAFDSFEIPGRSALERARIKRSGELFGYSYHGLRKYSPDQRASSAPRGLKSLDEIGADFKRAILLATKRGRGSLFRRAFDPLLRDVSFARAGLNKVLSRPMDLSLEFERMSSGHKIVVNIIAQLLATLQKSSLVLIDEPESHLHPPLVAALLQSINAVLEATESFAILATHSPVILQEVPAKYVQVIERFETRTHVRSPSIQTFGENIGLLTREAFNLDSSTTDFHSVLERIAVKRDMAEITELFGGKLSSQGRSYLASLGIPEGN